jgi:hypothetical protein
MNCARRLSETILLARRPTVLSKRRAATLLSAFLLASGVSALTAMQAHADTVDYGSSVANPLTCHGPDTGGSASSGWLWSSSGGYNSNDVIGSSSSPTCSGGFAYKLSVSGSNTFSVDWTYGTQYHSVAGKTCKYWAYIPSNHAGAPNAKYFVFAWSPTDPSHYMFNTLVNQETTTGWKYLGSAVIPSGHYATDVRLDNSEPSSPGWDVAFDAVAFHCS